MAAELAAAGGVGSTKLQSSRVDPQTLRPTLGWESKKRTAFDEQKYIVTKNVKQTLYSNVLYTENIITNIGKPLQNYKAN